MELILDWCGSGCLCPWKSIRGNNTIMALVIQFQPIHHLFVVKHNRKLNIENAHPRSRLIPNTTLILGGG